MNVPLDLFCDYLESKGLGQRTIKEYLYYFNKFKYPTFNQETVSRFLSEKGNMNIVARSFLLNLQKFLMLNYSELGLNQEVRVMISEVELPKITGRKKIKIPKTISHDSIPILESKLNNEKERLQLLLSYYCGLRLDELIRIKISSFNWQTWAKDRNQMGECKVYGKGNKEGLALVPSRLMNRISSYIHSNNFRDVNSYLFSYPGSNKVSITSLKRIWQRRLSEASVNSGITQLADDGSIIKDQSVSPHVLRHSFASYCLNILGLNIREVQSLLRHSSISTTQMYTHISKGDLKNRLSDL